MTVSARPGLCSTLSPKRRQTPGRASVEASDAGSKATVLPRGQKPLRPKIVKRAGSSVSPATIPEKTPIAATGPSVEVRRASASVRVSIASETVSPEARIVGPVRASAFCAAACLSSIRRSSSRYLETSNRQ